MSNMVDDAKDAADKMRAAVKGVLFAEGNQSDVREFELRVRQQ
jgi:hypothetical protein